MKLLLIATNKFAYGPRLIHQKSIDRGWSVDFYEYQDLSISLDEKSCKVYYKDSELDKPDAIILRSASSSKYKHYDFTRLRQAVVHAFSQKEIPPFILNEVVFTNFLGVYDKLAQMMVLQKHGVPVIPSQLFGGYDFTETVDTFPMLLKPLEGSHGFGIKKINSTQSLKRYAATLFPWQNFLQPHLDAIDDYRVMIIGDKVRGVIRRENAYKLGIQNKKKTSPKFTNQPKSGEVADLAKKAVSCLGLDYAGVDILRDQNGKLYVLEVNDSAGYKRLDEVIKDDVTEILLDYMTEMVDSKR